LGRGKHAQGRAPLRSTNSGGNKTKRNGFNIYIKNKIKKKAVLSEKNEVGGGTGGKAKNSHHRLGLFDWGKAQGKTGGVEKKIVKLNLVRKKKEKHN